MQQFCDKTKTTTPGSFVYFTPMKALPWTLQDLQCKPKVLCSIIAFFYVKQKKNIANLIQGSQRSEAAKITPSTLTILAASSTVEKLDMFLKISRCLKISTYLLFFRKTLKMHLIRTVITRPMCTEYKVIDPVFRRLKIEIYIIKICSLFLYLLNGYF